MGEYQYKINIPNNPFGIEIEFAGVLIDSVYYELEKVINNLIKCDICKKFDSKDYNSWCVKDDISIQVHDGIELKLGGEVTTPIMYNGNKYWYELRRVCESLKGIEGIRINDYCSIHIHTDKHIYRSIQEYINLLKLWMVYEDIIYRFGYGKSKTPRILITKYAKSISYYIYSILDKLESVQTEEELVKLFKYDRALGLNLLNIIKFKQTIETRVYNGSLDEVVIQNIVLFNQNLLEYAKIENFDKEFIDYKIMNYVPIFINDSLIENNDKAVELINLLVKDDFDRQKLFYHYK